MFNYVCVARQIRCLYVDRWRWSNAPDLSKSVLTPTFTAHLLLVSQVRVPAEIGMVFDWSQKGQGSCPGRNSGRGSGRTSDMIFEALARPNAWDILVFFQIRFPGMRWRAQKGIFVISTSCETQTYSRLVRKMLTHLTSWKHCLVHTEMTS